MEKRRLVLSCTKAQSRDWSDGRGRGCEEISLRFMFVFFVNRLCYSCYSPNIPSNNSKVRNQDDWLCWLSVICLTKKNEYWDHSVCVPWVSEKEGLQVSMQGGYQEGRMIPLFKLCWCAIWFLQSDETNCFLLIHSLMRSNLQKNSFQRFSLSFSQLCSFFSYPVLPCFQLLTF